MDSNLLFVLAVGTVIAVVLTGLGGPEPPEPIVIHVVPQQPRQTVSGCGVMLGIGLALVLFLMLMAR